MEDLPEPDAVFWCIIPAWLFIMQVIYTKVWSSCGHVFMLVDGYV